jgi:hypothetical protein
MIVGQDILTHLGIKKIMVIISHYELIFNSINNIFYVKSNDVSYCPFCNCCLSVKDSKNRTVISDDGRKQIYRIRRLICQSCNKIHSELPNFIQPFKHYGSEVIEPVLDEVSDQCPAENSTIKRWLKWFDDSVSYIECALTAIKIEVSNNTINLMNYSSIIDNIRYNGKGWLRRITQLLVNSGSWLSATI